VIIYHPDFSKNGYPVLRERVSPALDELGSRGLLDREGVSLLEAVPADEELVAEVHSESHIHSVMNSGYYEVALLSAGSVIRGAEEVASSGALSAFCFVGAAGHHASHDGFWGFCYLNDVAIAIAHIKGNTFLRRFAILDIDPHFGDGTRDILGDDPDVMHINFHSGFTVVGEDGPNNLDFTLPHDADDERFLAEVDKALKAAASFGPELFFVIFGHDNHRDDYGAFELSDDVYLNFAHRVKRYFPRRICYVLSGGSNPRVARRAIGDVVEVLCT
jgi:acetoin utilization deacetylase AcuC-like enzyme